MIGHGPQKLRRGTSKAGGLEVFTQGLNFFVDHNEGHFGVGSGVGIG